MPSSRRQKIDVVERQNGYFLIVDAEGRNRGISDINSIHHIERNAAVVTKHRFDRILMAYNQYSFMSLFMANFFHPSDEAVLYLPDALAGRDFSDASKGIEGLPARIRR